MTPHQKQLLSWAAFFATTMYIFTVSAFPDLVLPVAALYLLFLGGASAFVDLDLVYRRNIVAMGAPLDDPPPGIPERRSRSEVRRNEDETVILTALNEHEEIKNQYHWLVPAVKALLVCVIVLGVLDGYAIWQLYQQTQTAQSLSESNHRQSEALQRDRVRRMRESKAIAVSTCKAIQTTNNKLIAFVKVGDRLLRHSTTVSAQDKKQRLRLNHALEESLTIVCTQQGNPIQIK